MSQAFFRLFAARLAKGEVCSVAVTAENHLLMGMRRDNKRFTLPGGHMNTGESIHTGARRELREEAGIEISPQMARSFSHLGSDHVTTHSGKRLMIHSFHLALPTRMMTSVKNDPDMEVFGWAWEDVSQGLPKHIVTALHSPKNATLRRMGLLVY